MPIITLTPDGETSSCPIKGDVAPGGEFLEKMVSSLPRPRELADASVPQPSVEVNPPTIAFPHFSALLPPPPPVPCPRCLPSLPTIFRFGGDAGVARPKTSTQAPVNTKQMVGGAGALLKAMSTNPSCPPPSFPSLRHFRCFWSSPSGTPVPSPSLGPRQGTSRLSFLPTRRRNGSARFHPCRCPEYYPFYANPVHITTEILLLSRHRGWVLLEARGIDIGAACSG